jgi:hypothetical protein
VPPIPRDYSDLFLAPVALQVDQRLDEFAAMERDALHERVVVETNNEARTRAERIRDVIDTVTRLLDLHGWTAGWDDRGVRLSHGQNTLVLGVPRNLVQYVEELS